MKQKQHKMNGETPHKWRKQEFRIKSNKEEIVPLEIHSNSGEGCEIGGLTQSYLDLKEKTS